jgi:putative oligomerization/nucleic acid binding protein/phospholipase D-like protein
MSRLLSARRRIVNPALPALLALPILLAACSQVGGPAVTFWDVVFSMIVFFFWFMFIWIFIALFGDIFRRNDLSGGAKAGWIFLLVILPFLGALIYMIARPKVTAQDVEDLTRAEAATRAAAAVSPADQIAKLSELRAAGAISEAEFESLKAKAIGG